MKVEDCRTHSGPAVFFVIKMAATHDINVFTKPNTNLFFVQQKRGEQSNTHTRHTTATWHVAVPQWSTGPKHGPCHNKQERQGGGRSDRRTAAPRAVVSCGAT